MTYRVAEKNMKTDGLGNLQHEMWLRDDRGGFSLLRVNAEEMSRFSLGDDVVLTISPAAPAEATHA